MAAKIAAALSGAASDITSSPRLTAVMEAIHLHLNPRAFSRTLI
jgi:hypothetical protein